MKIKILNIIAHTTDAPLSHMISYFQILNPNPSKGQFLNAESLHSGCREENDAGLVVDAFEMKFPSAFLVSSETQIMFHFRS